MRYGLFDSHTHSDISDDAKDPFDMLCAFAIAGKLGGLALTNHCDLGSLRLPDWRERLKQSEQAVISERSKYSGRLEIALGIELGQPLEEPHFYKEIMESYNFDVIVCSIHSLPGEDDFYYMSADRPDRDALIERYVATLIETTRECDFDVLAHLTYPLRYLGYDDIMKKLEEKLRILFTLMAQKGIALEINTSGLYRTQRGPTLPTLWELELFLECGGKYITLGSDAHAPGAVGTAIRENQALLRRCGFTRFCTFCRRQPIWHEL